MTNQQQLNFLLVLIIAFLAPVVVSLVPRLRIPAVVLEIVLGIVVGPQVLGWAQPGEMLAALSRMGMGFLFFLAGLEIDFKAIRGRPIMLAGLGWLLSSAIALVLGSLLQWDGLVLDNVVVTVALTTTALGTLIPILRDAGELHTKFGTFVVAVGTVGEFGPIVLISVLLTTGNSGEHGGNAVISLLLLAAFAGIAVVAALIASRARSSFVAELFSKKLHTSAQLPIRGAVLLLFALLIMTGQFGLDSVLGALAAGVVVSIACQGTTGEVVRHKLEAIAFGFFVPLFFVTNGMKFDLHALTASSEILWRVPLFLALFLIARGVPVLLYRRDLPRGDLVPLALLSATALPLVVAVTEIAVETGRMRPANAAALVGAGMLSVLLFPLVALSLRKVESQARRSDIPSE